MRSFERRIKRLEERHGGRQGVVFLDREPEPGEFPLGTVVIVDDDVGSDADEEEKYG